MESSDWIGPLLLDSVEIARIPHGIPGIYMLLTHMPASGRFGTLYCGQSADLRARMSQHFSSAATAADFAVVRGHIKTYFSAAPVFSKPVRLALESGLIALLRPPFNRQIPRLPHLFPSLPAWAIVN